ncbi:hypothetical protein PR202_gb07893 [Eleusine coracana subsp. coracana]|uniref:Uncharacterized protein n=1 Tax=Eleusine coracana subsp. coracana TaxID=191504 RepID=A0AAV5EEB6_ELECO|nr:hypothetical protein PR202_gb07893 [Eleusine coracana subsp. coracana]
MRWISIDGGMTVPESSQPSQLTGNSSKAQSPSNPGGEFGKHGLHPNVKHSYG